MTLPANTKYGTFHQLWFLGRMRLMTVQAAEIINERPVHPILVKGLIHHLFVALFAQFSGRSPGLQGRTPLVASGALSLGNGHMGHVEYSPPGIGAVGIVAGNTVRIPYRVIHVRSFESELSCLMALFAEQRNLGFQQMISSGGCMRIVAVETPFALGHRFVLESRVADYIVSVLVTIKAESIPRLKEDGPII